MSKRLILVAALLGTIVSGGLLVVGWALSKPAPARIGAPPPDLASQPVTFGSTGGIIVQGWWCESSPSRGSVLLLPGIRANRLSMVGRARFLRRAGYSVLLIDLRATGETNGPHITFGWEERHDVLASVDFLRRRAPSGKVAIVGISLGGASALFAAPPLLVDALVLEAVYPTIERATDRRLRKYLGPIGPHLSSALLMQLRPRLGISPKNLRPVDHLASVHCPLLIMAGDDDHNTTPADTLMLFNAASEPKELWLIEHADHVDFHHFAPTTYEERVLKFLAASFDGSDHP